jgi:hypothetical protein
VSIKRVRLTQDAGTRMSRHELDGVDFLDHVSGEACIDALTDQPIRDRVVAARAIASSADTRQRQCSAVHRCRDSPRPTSSSYSFALAWLM